MAKMMQHSQNTSNYAIISLHDLLRNKHVRFDAKCYNINGQKAKALVSNCGFKKLTLNSSVGFANAWHRPRFKRIFTDTGMPIFAASQSRQLKPVPRKFISKRTKTNLNMLYLKQGQITMTCSGNIGLVTMVTDTLNGKLFSHDLLRIECHDERDAGYVYAFLKTKTGLDYVTTSKYGSVISHIEPEHLASVLIPDPPVGFKQKINKIINRVHVMRDNANALLKRANLFLFNELGLESLENLKDKRLNKPLCFTESKINLNSRLDSSFHVPVIGKIMSEINKTKHPVVFVGDKRVSDAIILPHRFKRTYVKSDFGIPFLGGKDILQYDHPNVKYLSRKKHRTRMNSELFLRENMVLITRSGTIGNVVLCPKYYDGWTASEHIIRIIPSNGINAGYLYAYLASDYGRELIKRYSHGSVVDEVTDHQISDIQIPLPDRKTMNRIGNLVLGATKKRDLAYRLEKEAIDLVENMILTNQKEL